MNCSYGSFVVTVVYIACHFYWNMLLGSERIMLKFLLWTCMMFWWCTPVLSRRSDNRTTFVFAYINFRSHKGTYYRCPHSLSSGFSLKWKFSTSLLLGLGTPGGRRPNDIQNHRIAAITNFIVHYQLVIIVTGREAHRFIYASTWESVGGNIGSCFSTPRIKRKSGKKAYLLTTSLSHANISSRYWSSRTFHSTSRP